MSAALTGAVVAAIAPAGPAEAWHRPAVEVEHDEATFLARNKIRVTETFDEYTEPFAFPPAQRTVSFRGMKIRSLDPVAPSWVIDGGADKVLERTFADTSGPDTADIAITFRRCAAVKALGFRIDPIGGVFELRVTERGGRSTTIGPFSLGPRQETYFGLTSRKGIVRVVVAQRPDLAEGTFSNFSIDDLSRSALIPPSQRG